jgi:hypothetical protein
MEAYSYAIAALLHTFTYTDKAEDAPTDSESEFVPFDLSYLRDFPEQRENKISSFGENGPHESHLVRA